MTERRITTAEASRPSDARRVRSALLAKAPPSRLLDSLSSATAQAPNARKRLIGPDINYGRELLVALARRRGGWIGWEAANLRGIAEQLAFLPLSRKGSRVAGDIEIGALVNTALDAALATGKVDKRFAALQSSLGFRHAVRDSLLELRMASVSPAELRLTTRPGTPAHELAAVVEQFERLLQQHSVVDPAGVFRAALDAFDTEAPFVLDGELFLAPGLVAHGLPGDLLARLVAHGATALDGDEPLGAGATAPDRALASASFFAAATPSDELRGVFRHAVAAGCRWDDIEIVTTDPDTYGIALDTLCQQLDVGVTMLNGIPLARTRLGRAIDRWIGWLSDGLAADVLREALEAGEMELAGSEVPSTSLARELRRLQVGWGRGRYEAAIAALGRGPDVTPRDDENDEEFATRKASRERSARGLRDFLVRLLDATPVVPERGNDRPVRTSSAKLAAAMLKWLELVPLHGMAENQTAGRITERLSQLARIEEPDVSFSSAIAGLRDLLSDVRAWPLVTEERKPWSASGGMVHLTDVAHAGTTGRAYTFVVGLDADRTSGAGRQDPLLTDSVRASLAGGRLPTSRERRAERGAQIARALAGLRGSVTLSYATSGSLDGREAGPAPILLECWRVAKNDRSLSFAQLRAALQPPASAVPNDARASIDARDAWLGAIADGALLLDGTALVRECFPMLNAGLTSADAAQQPVAGPHHGIVLDAAGAFDLVALGKSISPSSLELLGKCPLAWFYRHGLGLRPPNDPEYDPDAWLDAAQRGSLLHDVYEGIIRHHRGRQRDIASVSARDEALRIADEVIGQWRERVPPPGETVFSAEAAELRQSAIAFVEMERKRAEDGDVGVWWELEYSFGDASRPGRYELGTGETLGIHGRADRVDRMGGAGLRVIDYKTGRATRFQKSPKKAPFDGGRQLQPALYASVVQGLLGDTVSSFEYRFPTERGEAEIVAYDATELQSAVSIVRVLIEQAASGAFIPTTEPADCGYCDCQPICRVQKGEWNKMISPRAEWAAEHGLGLEVYRLMRALRGGDGATEEEP